MLPPTYTRLNDPDRLFALERLDLLTSPSEPAYDRLTRMVATLLDVPVALMSMIDHDRQFFKSQVGLPDPFASIGETPLSHSFCQHLVLQDAPLVISDAREHPLVADNPAIGDIGVVAYAGVPLRAPTGEILGALCAIDAIPRIWSVDEVALLSDLSMAVMTEIALRDKIQALQQSEARRLDISETVLLEYNELLDGVPIPVVPVTQAMLLVPLVGTIDQYRTQHLCRELLRSILEYGPTAIILDLTNMKHTNRAVTELIMSAVEIIQAHGIDVLVSGMTFSQSREVARNSVETLSFPASLTLEQALGHALQMSRYC